MITKKDIFEAFPSKHDAALRKDLRDRLRDGLSFLPLLRTIAFTAIGRAKIEDLENRR
jgi:hypothetical protein